MPSSNSALTGWFYDNVKIDVGSGKVSVKTGGVKTDGGAGVDTKITIDPSTGNVTVGAKGQSGNTGVTVSGAGTPSADGTVTGDSVSFGATIDGVSVSVKLTPNGMVPHPTDPLAPPVPSAKVEITAGAKKLYEYTKTVDDSFTMDDLFDREVDGSLSSGLLGNAYTAIRHRHREIDEAVNGPYEGSKSWRRFTDPLVLDLDGDGVE